METTQTNPTTTNSKHELDTKNAEQNTKRKKIIAMIAIIVLSVLIYALMTAVFPQKHKVPISQDGTNKSAPSVTCHRQQIPANKQAELDQVIQDAKDALATVDASLKEGEGTRLTHTAGFPLTDKGQTAIRDLSKAVDKAKQFKNTHTATVGTEGAGCPNDQGDGDIDAAIKTLRDQTQSFIDIRDAYRQDKAADEDDTSAYY